MTAQDDGVSAAGSRFDWPLGSGEAVCIFTGAPMPDGADHVVIQEDTRCDSDGLVVVEPRKRASNVRAPGVDFSLGSVLVKARARLDGPKLALAAAASVDRVEVVRRPRVALIANGDELEGVDHRP